MGEPAEEHDQQGGEDSEQDDAVGEHQPVAQVRELARRGSRRRARMEESRGKSAKLVLAARISTPAVAACKMK